jgi:intracellular multiplication protein IcmJ
MKKIPIILGIGRKAASAPSQSGGNKNTLSAELKEKIFTRDDYTCRCCAYQSKKYQDILFINGNTGDMRQENMATTCIFCHQCFNLDQVSDMRSGVLIWLPEIPQDQLHHIARAAYVARISQGPVADAARRTLDLLMARREDATARLGTDNPLILAEVMKDYMTPKIYDLRRQKLDGIKLLPLDRRIIREADLEFNQFPQILAFWRSKNGPFAGKTPKDWVKIYAELHPDSGKKSLNEPASDDKTQDKAQGKAAS